MKLHAFWLTTRGQVAFLNAFLVCYVVLTVFVVLLPQLKASWRQFKFPGRHICGPQLFASSERRRAAGKTFEIVSCLLLPNCIRSHPVVKVQWASKWPLPPPPPPAGSPLSLPSLLPSRPSFLLLHSINTAFGFLTRRGAGSICRTSITRTAASD